MRKTPIWPSCWANFNLLQLYPHRNACANLHTLGQPNTILARFSILGRQLKRVVINAAFAGPGREQLNITRYVSQMRGAGGSIPAAIVFDCCPGPLGAVKRPSRFS